MKILFDLHTHTKNSDGKGTILENMDAAFNKKILLGISDHGAGHGIFGMRNKNLISARAQIEQANEKRGFELAKIGVEANLYAPGKTDIFKYEKLPDYILMGFHRGLLSSYNLKIQWNYYTGSSKVAHRLTDAIIKALENEPIDVLTHPGEYIPIVPEEICKAATALGVVLEINNKHAYNISFGNLIMESGVHVLLSSDAHKPQNIGNVSEAIEYAKGLKIPASRVINSTGYTFDKGLRIDRLKEWVIGTDNKFAKQPT